MKCEKCKITVLFGGYMVPDIPGATIFGPKWCKRCILQHVPGDD